MSDIVPILHEWVSVEGLSDGDPESSVGAACKKAADEIERLRAHIAEIEAWHEEGAKLFDNYAVGLGAMFGLGKWWGERPWR